MGRTDSNACFAVLGFIALALFTGCSAEPEALDVCDVHVLDDGREIVACVEILTGGE